jgi:hypothetical protein
MIIRRAGLAVLAASALTLPLPTAALAESPGESAAVFPGGPGESAGSAAGSAGAGGGGIVPAAPVVSGPAAARGIAPGWPLPVPDVSALLPGLYAVNVASLQCLTAPGGSGPAFQRRCVLDDAYRWKLVPVSLDGRFKVENAGSGRCLVPAGGVDLAAGPCGEALGDTWRLKDAPGTGIYVINASSDRCLTATPSGAAVQYRCDGTVARRWTFRLKPNGKGVVTVNGGKP